MSKVKLAYSCNECGAITNKWVGQCPECNSWNSFTESVVASTKSKFSGYAGMTASNITQLKEILVTDTARISSQIAELDRVLGGGIVPGSVTLVGGDPGIGKSTLLLQMMCLLSKQDQVLYVTGEESLQQVKLRAQRLQFADSNLQLLTETRIETILELVTSLKTGLPKVMVLDSIQTMYTDLLQSAPGSVGQVRESTAQLVKFAKNQGIAIFLVGHVTKEGAIAGPRVLEHMVDTVLYFEGQSDNRYRIIRAQKNRFGAVNELGIFAMTDKGLSCVNNPSAIFLSRHNQPSPGSAIMVMWEGSRPMLIEIQALVDESHLANPRRVTLGLDHNRLALSLAVLHRHADVITFNQDVFINVVGGIRITETGVDVPMLLAVLSSLKNKPIPQDLVTFGEIGLSGEIRPVQSGQERLKEAKKLGFTRAIVPKANMPKEPIEGFKVIGIDRLDQLVAELREL
jgi:DNA repair protein RadA/Sms